MKNLKRFQSLILILLSLFILTSCSSGTIPPPELPEPTPTVEEIYLNVPVVKQEQSNWCLPAATQAVLKYYGMEITQEELAEHAINNETGLGSPGILQENADKLGIEVENKQMYLEEIKDEIIKKGNPVIVLLQYSLDFQENHSYVIDGFNDEKLKLMCPSRGYVYYTYDYVKQLNDNVKQPNDDVCINKNIDLYYVTLVWPKDKFQINNLTNTEKAMQIAREQTDLFNKF